MTRRPAEPKPVPAKWNHFAHLEPYWMGNSIPGLDLAVDRRYPATDLDAQCTRDLIVINVHGATLREDGFRDPLGKISPDAHYCDLTWRQVARLRRPDGQRILTARRMIREAHARGLRVELEAKISRGLEQPQTWVPIARTVRRLGADVQVKTLTTLPVGARPGRRLKAAHSVGLTTIALPRSENGFQVRREWEPFIDFYRGRIEWVRP